MNHQAIIDQLSHLAPQLKGATSPESVLVKYASDRNFSAAQLERMGQVYNIAKTLNFMDKTASSNRGDSFRVLNMDTMLSDFTKFKPIAAADKQAASDWDAWFDIPGVKRASVNADSVESWLDVTEKQAKVVEEDGQYAVYNKGGDKRLSNPGTKEAAEKRLRQIEYFENRKAAGWIPNINALANDSSYTDNAVASAQDTDALPTTPTAFIKDEVRKEATAAFELQTVDQVISDANEELVKIAAELFELNRISTLPYAIMESDAYYCADKPESIKAASNAIAGYFEQRGWSLDRFDPATTPAPKLVRDRHAALPIFKAAAEQIDLIKASRSYKEYLLKEATQTKSAPTHTTSTGGGNSTQTIQFPSPPTRTRTPAPAASPTSSSATDLKNELMLLSAGRGNRDDGSEKKDKKDKKEEDFSKTDVKSIANGIADIYSPSTYINKTQQDFIDSAFKAPSISSVNNRQKKVDVAAEDVGRVSTLQRLLLTDPIIGEADPDSVVSLYNTLAKANPEIVKDSNLLRFALREALSYDAVPLHTYKDLISMGKDRADTQEKTNRLERERYAI